MQFIVSNSKAITQQLLEAAVSDDEDWKYKEQVKNSLIGNGFHFPSAMLVFMLLLQFVNPVTSLRAMGPAAEEA